MKELWYERAAMRGEPMPEELNFIDCWMFQSLAALYFRFFQKAISQEQGKEEKKIPVVKMSGLGVSIKRPKAEEEAKRRAEEEARRKAEEEARAARKKAQGKSKKK